MILQLVCKTESLSMNSGGCPWLVYPTGSIEPQLWHTIPYLIMGLPILPLIHYWAVERIHNSFIRYHITGPRAAIDLCLMTTLCNECPEPPAHSLAKRRVPLSWSGGAPGRAKTGLTQKVRHLWAPHNIQNLIQNLAGSFKHVLFSLSVLTNWLIFFKWSASTTNQKSTKQF